MTQSFKPGDIAVVKKLPRVGTERAGIGPSMLDLEGSEVLVYGQDGNGTVLARDLKRITATVWRWEPDWLEPKPPVEDLLVAT